MDRRNAVLLVSGIPETRNANADVTDEEALARWRLLHLLSTVLEDTSFDLVAMISENQMETEAARIYGCISHPPPESNTASAGMQLPVEAPPEGFGEQAFLRLRVLEEEDPSERWRQSVLFAFEDGYERVIVLRDTCVDVSVELFERSFDSMSREVEVILGTSRGGGCAWLGLNGVYLELFRELPWGTSSLAAVMEDRARGWHLALEIDGPFVLFGEDLG